MVVPSHSARDQSPAANEVVTIGEALGLLLADDGVPLRAARHFTRHSAGAELNVSVALARLGHRCAFIGRVGDDPFGEDVLATLRTEGVDATGVIVDHDARTGLLIRDYHGERALRVIYRRSGSAGSRLAPDDLDPTSLDGAQLLHVTGITPALSASARAALGRALDAADERSVPVSFDPNFRRRLWSADDAAPIMRALAARATIILASEREAEWLSRHQGYAAAADWFLSQGAQIVAIKRGANGAWVTARSGSFDVPPLAVTAPVDPVGAGDAFDAGFLSRWLRGDGLEICGRYGAALGAACVRAAGDLDGLPTSAELDSVLGAAPDVDR